MNFRDYYRLCRVQYTKFALTPNAWTAILQVNPDRLYWSFLQAAPLLANGFQAVPSPPPDAPGNVTFIPNVGEYLFAYHGPLVQFGWVAASQSGPQNVWIIELLLEGNPCAADPGQPYPTKINTSVALTRESDVSQPPIDLPAAIKAMFGAAPGTLNIPGSLADLLPEG